MTEHRDEFVPASLSMKCFFYDALLETDKAAYASFVLEQIRQLYSMMLDHGATTVWEDEKGASAFNDAAATAGVPCPSTTSTCWNSKRKNDPFYVICKERPPKMLGTHNTGSNKFSMTTASGS